MHVTVPLISHDDDLHLFQSWDMKIELRPVTETMIAICCANEDDQIEGQFSTRSRARSSSSRQYTTFERWTLTHDGVS